MDLNLLKTLQHKLEVEKDFSGIYTYFMDHFGENPAFFDAGVPAENELLTQMIARISAAMLKKDPAKAHLLAIDQLHLLSVPQYGFYHGGFVVEGKLGCIFYFETISKGLMAMTDLLGRSGTNFCRFTPEMLTPQTDLSPAFYKQ